jgi:hypothetical protein
MTNATIKNDEESTVATVEDDAKTNNNKGATAKGGVAAGAGGGPGAAVPPRRRNRTAVVLGAAGTVIIVVVAMIMLTCLLLIRGSRRSSPAAATTSNSMKTTTMLTNNNNNENPCDPNPCSAKLVCTATNTKNSAMLPFLCQENTVEREEDKKRLPIAVSSGSTTTSLGECPKGGSHIKVRRQQQDDDEMTIECLLDQSATPCGAGGGGPDDEDASSSWPCRQADDTCVYLAEFNQVFCYATASPCAGNPCNDYNEYCHHVMYDGPRNNDNAKPFLAKCTYAGGLS